MKKYIVEGGIDFFAELYKSLDDDEDNNKTEEDNNKCLITNQPLTDMFVELSCGHKFNYLPLYNDVLNHKKKFNNMEGNATRLKQNELRCPYCRKRSTDLLPYYEDLNLPKVAGVNHIDSNYDGYTDTIPTSSYYKKCEYLTPNIHFNFNSENVTEVYKSNLNLEDCKYIKCSYMGTQIDYPSNFDKPHDFSLVSNYRFSHRFSASFNTTYSTGRPITVPVGKYYYAGSLRASYSGRNEFRAPDYFRTDFSLNIEGNHKIHQLTHSSWTIGIYNVTGRDNAYSTYFVSEKGVIKGYQLSIFGNAIPFVNYNIRF